MRPLRPRFIALVLALPPIAFTPAPAAAQLTVLGLAWGTPAAQVRTRLASLGYRFRGIDQAGDHVFGGAGMSEVVAMFDSAGVVQVEQSWPSSVAMAQQRYRMLDDSLRRVLGRPQIDRYPNELTWERGGEKLAVVFDDRRRAQGEAITVLVGDGPGYRAETERRHALSEAESRRNYAAGSFPRDSVLEGEWVFVAGDRRNQVLLDTASITKAGNGVYRVRIREEWRDLRRMMNGRFFDAELRSVEIDCAAPRWRRLRTIRFANQTWDIALPLLPPSDWVDWTAPAAGTKYGRALRQSCAVARRRAG